MTSRRSSAVLPFEHIARSIRILRGQRVLLDAELAVLYGVTTKRFNEQVRRNRGRFPADFMFQLTNEEVAALRSHSATLKSGRGQHRKYLPHAFTEHGAIMAATVLNSPRATEMTVYVVRAFVKLREILASNKALARRFDQLEARLQKLTAQDEAIAAILSALRELMAPAQPPRRRPIGFTANLEQKT
jgi:phage regulator Rha-like protein